MKKRQFLTKATGLVAGAIGATLSSSFSNANAADGQSKSQSKPSQTILTVAGKINKTNRGAFGRSHRSVNA